MKIYISNLANEILLDYLKGNNYKINLIQDLPTYESISAHPDILMCQIKNKVFKGNSKKIGFSYPSDIIYNGAVVGDYFIHNLKYTSNDLLNEIDRLYLKKIHVNQGYSKCNILPVGNHGIITSDKGIANTCCPYLDVLLIESGHIMLPGLNYGFIGGCAGTIDDTILFNGNLKGHPDFEKIIDFIKSKNMKALWFEEYPLTDIGSILVEEE